MTVHLDQANGSSSEAFGDCFTISLSDGALGDTPVAGDSTVLQLTYDGAAPAGATAARLHALVHSNYGGTTVVDRIIVTALSGGIDPYSLLDVTGNGFTYVDSTGGTDVIRVVYDVSSCNGNGIHVFDVDGNEISLPRAPLLYHELSHAFRAATDTLAPDDEPPAETDENVMRSTLGYCLRDVNNHDGGCGRGSDCSGPPTPGDGGCFIVSAATGSATSLEVQLLRRLRDRVSAKSVLCARLIDAIYEEYERLSPPIADEIREEPMARQLVLTLVVQPLLAWYRLAGAVAFDRAEPSVVTHHIETWRRAKAAAGDTRALLALLESVRDGTAASEQLPPIVRPVLTAFGPTPACPLTQWAILDALRGAFKADDADGAVRGGVAQWLAAAPIERLPTWNQTLLLEQELAALARIFDFDPEARWKLGARLAERRATALDALRRHGFIGPSDA